MQEYFEIGQIVNTFGIKGEVKVNPFTDDVEQFERLKSILVVKNKQLVEMEIENVRYQKHLVILKLKNIEDMNTAEKLKGCYIKIHRKDARKLPKGKYFIADIIGSGVVTDDGKSLGKVDDIYNTGSNDIYVVKDELGKQLLLPAISDVIKEINLDERRIVVHILKGLI